MKYFSKYKYNATDNKASTCGKCGYFGDIIQCPYFDFVVKNTDYKKFGCYNFYCVEQPHK